jgi:hypothetical protein
MHRAASAGTCKMVSRGRRMECVRVAPHHRDARGERAGGGDGPYTGGAEEARRRSRVRLGTTAVAWRAG